MNNRVFALLLIFALAATCALGADPIGKIVALTGSANAVNEAGNSRDLEMKSPIYQNDTITTDASSKLQIMFDDTSVISQGEKSEITIDEYVYSEEEEENVSATVRIARGLFRVVTGKITDLNPKRFRVKTRMATIGIRGCDLGFRDDGGELIDILILHLPPGKEIIIEKTAGGDLDEDILTVVDGGVTVSVGPGTPLAERPMTSLDASAFFEMLLTDDVGGDTDSAESDVSDKASLLGDSSRTTVGRGGGIDGISSAGSQAEQAEQAEEDTEEQKDEIELASAPVDVPSISVAPPVEETPQSDPKDTSGPTEAPPENPDPPTTPTPPVLAAGQNGTHWGWTMFDDASMEYGIPPPPPPGVAGDWFTASEFEAITGNLSPQTLSGSGRSGAMVDHGGPLVKLEGTADLTVNIPGSGTTPTWSGTFDMNNTPDGKADTLNFSAQGDLSGWGALKADPISSYTLFIDGQTYNAASITAQAMAGHLVGPGTDATTISGAAGQWAIKHSDGTRVDSVFGADLR